MAYEDPYQVAGFLADFRFSITGKQQKPSQPDLMVYYCTLSKGDIAFSTSYLAEPGEAAPTGLEVFRGLTADACAIVGRSRDACLDGWGLRPSQAIRAYENCQDSLNWLKEGLSLGVSDILDLNQTLVEKADEVRDALAHIASARAAAYAREHPAVPEGFVTIESLLEGLDIGEYGSQCADYGMDNISDRFYDVAEESTDILFQDLLKWLPDHFEWIKAAEESGRLKEAEGSLLEMVQIAQSECFRKDMFDHREGIVRYVTLSSLKEEGAYAVSQELAGALVTKIDYAHADTFSSLFNEAVKQIQNVLITSLSQTLGNEGLAHFAAHEILDGLRFSIVNPCALSVRAVRDINEKGYDRAFAESEFWKKYMEQADAHKGVDAMSLADVALESRSSSAGLTHGSPTREGPHDTVGVEH